MKASELRIGNLVYEDDGQQLSETYITPEKLINILEGDSGFKPILLTEEWVEKFGWEPEYRVEEGKFKGATAFQKYFESLGSEQLMVLNGKYYWYRRNSLSRLPDDWDYDCIEVQYIHQLQNLYFALTGDELPPPPTES